MVTCFCLVFDNKDCLKLCCVHTEGLQAERNILELAATTGFKSVLLETVEQKM